jgi:hypothetical protein
LSREKVAIEQRHTGQSQQFTSLFRQAMQAIICKDGSYADGYGQWMKTARFWIGKSKPFIVTGLH